MRRTSLLIATLAWGAVAVAQVGDARRPQIDAAVANAVDGLYQEVARTPISGSLTVGALIDRIGGRQELLKSLQGAQEIGGPRWLDDQTAQVRLEISGTQIAQTLVQLSASNPRIAPIRADALASMLADWNRKTFGAVGTSTGAAAAIDVRPSAVDPAWASVPEQTRRAAIESARANAVQGVIDGVRAVELKQGATVAHVMDRPGSPVRERLEQYLAERPVTGVQFRPDRQVEIGLSVPATDLTSQLRDAVAGLNDPSLAGIDWTGVADRVARGVGTGVGVSTAASIAAPGTRSQPPQLPDSGAAVVRIPDEPPEWVWRQIDADASAQSGGGSALKCARAAERAAVEKLRLQVEALSLDGMTVGEAGRKDPRIADAVSRGLGRARVYKTDYQPDGSATVYVSLELRDVWEQLRPR